MMKSPVTTSLWLIVAFCLGYGAYRWFAAPTLPPPTPVNLSELDPMISEYVEQALAWSKDGPGDAPRRVALGMVYHANGMNSLAEECYRQAIKLDAGERRANYLMALALADQGRTDRALLQMESAISITPDYPPAHWRKGWWLLQQGDFSSAESAFSRSAELAPGNLGAVHGLFRVLVESGDAQLAVDALKAHLQKQPDDTYAYFLLGTALRNLGDIERATPFLARGAGSKAGGADPWMDEMRSHERGIAAIENRCQALLKNGQFAAAVKLLEPYQKQYRDDPTLAANLGMAYTSAGREVEAEELLKDALERFPLHGQLHIAMADLMERKQAFDVALSHLERAIDTKFSSSNAFQRKSRILAAKSDWTGALEAIREAISRDPGDVLLLKQSAGLHAQLGDWDGADKAVERAATLAPFDQELGRMKEKLVELREAGSE
jgi:tetratricopeptide (TPR) repeat protein